MAETAKVLSTGSVELGEAGSPGSEKVSVGPADAGREGPTGGSAGSKMLPLLPGAGVGGTSAGGREVCNTITVILEASTPRPGTG